MAEILSVLAIFVALAFMTITIYKGLNPVLAAFFASVIIIVMSGLPFTETLTEAFAGAGNQIGSLMPTFIFGGILGVLYVSSGAAVSFINFFMRPCDKVKNSKMQLYAVLAMFMAARFVISLAGINNGAIMATMVGMNLVVARNYNIPTRFVPCIQVVAGSMANLLPGVANTHNLICELYFDGFKASDNMVVRFILILIFVAVSIIFIAASIEKDRKKGIGFEESPNMKIPDFGDKKKIPWFFGLIPIVVVFCTYNFLSLNAWQSLGIGLIFALVFFAPYIQPRDGKSKLRTIMADCDRGVYVMPLVSCAVVIVANTMNAGTGIDNCVTLLSRTGLPAMIVFLLIAVVVTGFGGFQSLAAVGALAMSTFVPAGLGASACACIAIWSSSVFDTLPTNNGLVIQSNMVGKDMSETYPPIFVTTVALTFGIALLAGILAVMGIIR